jgi:alpha,alpha-trehalase
MAGEENDMSIWLLTYQGYDPDQEPLRETLCTLGNGYFATRGAAPESRADGVHYLGTYVAGCFNRLKSEVAGEVVENESIVNMPNWLVLDFAIEDTGWFDPGSVQLEEYEQTLDMYGGVLTRSFVVCDSNGRRTRVSQRRFVHMANPHLGGLQTTFVAENWSGGLQVRSGLDGRVTNSGVARYREFNGKHLVPVEVEAIGEDTVHLQVETTHSRLLVSEAARTRVLVDGEPADTRGELFKEPGSIALCFSLQLEKGIPVNIEKVVALFTSRDRAVSEPGLDAKKEVSRAQGFEELLESHRLAWENLWRECGIEVDSDERSALVLHLHIFHLLQTISRNTTALDVGVPPRGLHGEAYRGHILWDELFVFPFLNLRIPEVTRALLQYRYYRLDEARWLARQAGYRGAMYPWQSGSNGREESQRIHLNPLSGRWIPDNSSLQRHVNIAVAYNVWSYYQVTGDVDFLSLCGAEMLIEIARFWASIARYNLSIDRYEIRGVMGPDEYHDRYPDSTEPGLDNNSYTNVMAVWVLCRALEVLDHLPADRREALWDSLGLSNEELDLWAAISRKMRVAFHGDGIISQFERYDDLEEFDWEGYQAKYGNIQRLDRILESEGDSPNRYKVSKQADVLMLFYLLSADELGDLFERLGYPFDYETIPKNVDYYAKRTSHGSTLSRIVHSWVLARSQREKSWHLFETARESDISDIQGGTTSEGVHLGAMVGSVDLVQRCYTGMETRDGALWLNPYLPRQLRELQYDVRYRLHRLTINVSHESIRISAGESNATPIAIVVRDKAFELKHGESKEVLLKR